MTARADRRHTARTRPPLSQLAGRAFSVVELLVVIAMSVLLLALLLPSLQAVRRRALATQCLAQLWQIGVAQHAYPTDHRDWLVPVTIYGANHAPYGLTWDAGQAEWSRILRWKGYINDSVAPTNRNVQGIMRCQSTFDAGGSYSYTSSYGMNGAIGGYMLYDGTNPMQVGAMMWYLPNAAWRRLRRLHNPALTYMVADVVNTSNRSSACSWPVSPPRKASGNESAGLPVAVKRNLGILIRICQPYPLMETKKENHLHLESTDVYPQTLDAMVAGCYSNFGSGVHVHTDGFRGGHIVRLGHAGATALP